LRSIVIPWTVEFLGAQCFWVCGTLLSVKFELHSRVSVIEENAFRFCLILDQILIPSRLEALFVNALQDSPEIQIEDIETDCILRAALSVPVRADGSMVGNAENEVDVTSTG
jgi:hypothetical protein